MRAVFNSKEAATFKPQLVIAYMPPPRMMDNIQPDANATPYFNIFPNPAGNYFNISLKNMEGDANLEIYDLIGKLVMKKIIGNNDIYRIDAENLENGVYLVVVSNGNGVLTKKVLLNKE